MKNVGCLFLFLSLFFISTAQNLTGTWEGKSADASYWRIGIIHIGDSCYGYSYDEGPGHCTANFVAAFNSKENHFKGRSVSFIEKTFGHMLFSCNMQYKKKGEAELLRGSVRPKSAIMQAFTLGIGMQGQLKKISNRIDTTLFVLEILQRLNKNTTTSTTVSPQTRPMDSATAFINHTPDSSALKKVFSDSLIAIKESRASIIQQSIITAADTVTIILYDDGEIDGDIVTVFNNGEVVINQLTLTKQPYQFTIALPSNGSKHSIELMAENEGSLPPNTAYMLVLAGSQRVEVKASSDKLSNAAIVIQKEKQ